MELKKDSKKCSKIQKTDFPKVFLDFGKWTFLKMSKIDF